MSNEGSDRERPGLIEETRAIGDPRDGLDPFAVDAPQCYACVHWVPDPNEARCAAFSGGIPEAIWRGRHNHQLPFPGDRGITFTPAETDVAARNRAAFQAAVIALFERTISAADPISLR